jgi:hypothetical protein
MPCEDFYQLPRRIEECRVIWQIDRRLFQQINSLRDRIDLAANLDRKTLESKIALYLLQQLREHPENNLLQEYWRAFLFKRCAEVCRDLMSKLPTILNKSDFPDLFTAACQVTIDPAKFLRNFNDSLPNPNYWYPTLKSFSFYQIKYLLFAKIRDITGFNTLGHSLLGLVARSSRKQIKNALQTLGCSDLELEQYLFAWDCFKEVKESISLSVNNFTPEQFKLIADRYNILRPTNYQPANSSTMKMWLEKIGEAIRHLLDPPFISIDSFLDENEGETTVGELLPSSEDDFLSLPELNSAVEDLRECFVAFIKNLKIDEQKILLFRHGSKLTQAIIAREIGLDQPTINRYLQRLHALLATEITVFMQTSYQLPLPRSTPNLPTISQIASWGKEHLGSSWELSSEVVDRLQIMLDDYYSKSYE